MTVIIFITSSKLLFRATRSVAEALEMLNRIYRLHRCVLFSRTCGIFVADLTTLTLNVRSLNLELPKFGIFNFISYTLLFSVAEFSDEIKLN